MDKHLPHDLVDRLIVTHVPGTHIGDVYFPKWYLDRWTIVAKEQYEGFRVLEYEKK